MKYCFYFSVLRWCHRLSKNNSGINSLCYLYLSVSPLLTDFRLDSTISFSQWDNSKSDISRGLKSWKVLVHCCLSSILLVLKILWPPAWKRAQASLLEEGHVFHLYPLFPLMLTYCQMWVMLSNLILDHPSSTKSLSDSHSI